MDPALVERLWDYGGWGVMVVVLFVAAKWYIPAREKWYSSEIEKGRALFQEELARERAMFAEELERERQERLRLLELQAETARDFKGLLRELAGAVVHSEPPNT